jgi:hypothetical protein
VTPGHSQYTYPNPFTPPAPPCPKRLTLTSADAASSQPLPLQLLRKYIAYARAHVTPMLSDEAKEALQVGLALQAAGYPEAPGGNRRSA